MTVGLEFSPCLSIEISGVDDCQVFTLYYLSTTLFVAGCPYASLRLIAGAGPSTYKCHVAPACKNNSTWFRPAENYSTWLRRAENYSTWRRPVET